MSIQKVRQEVKCDVCKGSRLLFDAYVKWDKEEQEYMITMISGKPIICEDCDKEVSITWEEVIYENVIE